MKDKKNIGRTHTYIMKVYKKRLELIFHLNIKIFSVLIKNYIIYNMHIISKKYVVIALYIKQRILCATRVIVKMRVLFRLSSPHSDLTLWRKYDIFPHS